MNYFSAQAISTLEQPAAGTLSPLVLADRLITLAKDADRGGFVTAADHLVRLAYTIWDTPILDTPILDTPAGAHS